MTSRLQRLDTQPVQAEWDRTVYAGFSLPHTTPLHAFSQLYDLRLLKDLREAVVGETGDPGLEDFLSWLRLGAAAHGMTLADVPYPS